MFRPLPLVPLPLYRWFGLQIPHSPEAEPAEDPSPDGKGSPPQPGDVAEVKPLVVEIYGLLQLLRIERRPLGEAHAGTFREECCTA